VPHDIKGGARRRRDSHLSADAKRVGMKQLDSVTNDGAKGDRSAATVSDA
jgi:hypothetical protein